MLRRLALLLAIITLLLIGYEVLASSNDRIPACTAADAASMARAISDAGFGDDYSEIVTQVKDFDVASGDLVLLIESVSQLQSSWWNDITTSFPDCALAVQVTNSGGRVLDELLIGVSVGEAGYKLAQDDDDSGTTLVNRAKHHIDEWTTAQTEFLELIGELGDLAKSK